jgi:hypothetical protein
MYQYNTTSENQLFYEWEGLAEKWLTTEQSFDSDYPSKPQDLGTSLAAHIVEKVFELTLDPGSKNKGSYLPGYDVQNREAYQMIQLSLAEELSNQEFIECYADENGIVKFYTVGKTASDIGSDVLYSISSAEIKQKCDNVIVEGYDPPFKKFTRGPYDLFTFAQTYYTPEIIDRASTKYDPLLFKYPFKYSIGDMMGPEYCKYYKEGYIVYGDPGFTDPRKVSGPGRVYDHKAFEEVIEWIHEINIPFYKQGSTTVSFEGKSPIYKEIPNFGKLQNRIWRDNQQYIPALCQTFQDITDPDVGVLLEDSDSPKFLGVKEVIIFGYQLKNIQIDEYVDSAGKIQKGPADFVVDIDSMQHEPLRLTQGDDYLVMKDKGNSGKYRLIFSANVSPNYITKFGGKNTTVTKIRVSPTAVFGKKVSEPPTCEGGTKIRGFFDLLSCTGWARDGKSPLATRTVYEAIIYCTGEGTTGYAMNPKIGKIFVVYDWDAPCVHLTDLEDSISAASLGAVSINIYPIIQKDLPRPIAMCSKGNLSMLDPRQGIPDSDAGTIENLTTSPYQRAMDGLENGDIRVTFPFMACDTNPWEDCALLKNTAKFIYELQNEVVESTTYTCNPEAKPVLGEVIDGKTINSIDYSYQDASQYMISVQAGPVWQGFGGWDQSIYQNKTERAQLEGVVRSVNTANRSCLVQLEQIGYLECINGTSDILETGDVVKVTAYNNPVSI